MLLLSLDDYPCRNGKWPLIRGKPQNSINEKITVEMALHLNFKCHLEAFDNNYCRVPDQYLSNRTCHSQSLTDNYNYKNALSITTGTIPLKKNLWTSTEPCKHGWKGFKNKNWQYLMIVIRVSIWHTLCCTVFIPWWWCIGGLLPERLSFSLVRVESCVDPRWLELTVVPSPDLQFWLLSVIFFCKRATIFVY